MTDEMDKYERAICTAMRNYMSDMDLDGMMFFNDSDDLRLIVEAVTEMRIRKTGIYVDFSKEVENTIKHKKEMNPNECPLCHKPFN